MNSVAPSDELVAEILDELARELKRLLYPREHFESMRALKNPTEKLVYLYIWLTQPQTFSSIKQGLGLHKASVARALKRLETKGLVVRDGNLLYI
jgi:DNA-binding MarR family transcriptional regulator